MFQTLSSQNFVLRGSKKCRCRLRVLSQRPSLHGREPCANRGVLGRLSYPIMPTNNRSECCRIGGVGLKRALKYINSLRSNNSPLLLSSRSIKLSIHIHSQRVVITNLFKLEIRSLVSEIMVAIKFSLLLLLTSLFMSVNGDADPGKPHGPAPAPAHKGAPPLTPAPKHEPCTTTTTTVDTTS